MRVYKYSCACARVCERLCVCERERECGSGDVGQGCGVSYIFMGKWVGT